MKHLMFAGVFLIAGCQSSEPAAPAPEAPVAAPAEPAQLAPAAPVAAAPAAAPTEPVAQVANVPTGGEPTEIVVAYRARITDRDRLSSKGVRLGDVGAILRQDRAWVHKFQDPDAGDERDTFFDKLENRKFLEREVRYDKDATVTERCQDSILKGNPLVQVTVFVTHIQISCLPG